MRKEYKLMLAALAGAFCCLVLGCILISCGFSTDSAPMTASGLLGFFLLPIAALVFFIKGAYIDIKEQRGKSSPRQGSTEKERRAQAQQQREARRAQAQQAREERRKHSRSTIVEVKLLGGGSMVYKRAGLGGAALGGFMAGLWGILIGALMPSTKGVQKQCFAVQYGDGHIELKEVHPNSWEYKMLMKYVKWDDLS